MKLWTSGEIFAPIYDDFRLIRNEIEHEFNAIFENKEYGGGLISWNIIFVILETADHKNYPERFRYSAKNKDSEFRPHIDYETFFKASKESRFKLLVFAMLRTIQYLKKSKTLKEFDIQKFEIDFVNFTELKGWS